MNNFLWLLFRCNIMVAFIGIIASVWSATLIVPTQFNSISLAMIKARPYDTVLVGPGIYHERIIVSSGVTLKSSATLRAVIHGSGRGTVVRMNKNATIRGFVVRSGTIGIVCAEGGVTIAECQIIHNRRCGIVCARHLPQIEDNLIAFNYGTGIQGWDVRSLNTSINHNTLAFNAGSAIVLGGSSTVVAENNIIAFNDLFAFKFDPDGQTITIKNNDIYGNLKSSYAFSGDNIFVDPLFIAPRKSLNFNLKSESPCLMKASDSENLGARLTLVPVP